MSAVQAAIRRRATINPTSNQVSSSSSSSQNQNNAQQQQQNISGLTLQQVVQVIDNRLLNLEAFMKDVKSAPSVIPTTQQTKEMTQDASLVDGDVTLNTIIDEYNHRFELIADEISHMKEIIIKLQTFTMEVNKKILDNYLELVSNNMFSMTTTTASPPMVLETTSKDIESEPDAELETETEPEPELETETLLESKGGEPEIVSFQKEEEEEIKPVFKKGSSKSNKSK
jgi:hypothetical protein